MRRPHRFVANSWAAAGILAAACLLLTACQSGVSMTSDYIRKPVAWPRMKKSVAADDAARSPAAVILGVQWLNPLMRRSYPTQWNLLWAQGLAQPNANDKEAARFKLGDVVGSLVGGGLKPGETPADYPWAHFDKRAWIMTDLLDRPLSTFTSYAVDPNYFYSIRMGTDRPDYMDARVFAGMSQEWIGTPTYISENQDGSNGSVLRAQEALGVPAPSVLAYDAVHAESRMRDYWVTLHKDRDGETVRGAPALDSMIIGERTLTLNAARRLVFNQLALSADCKSLTFNPTGKLPNVTVMAGVENVGFYSLRAALQYLAENSTHLVWVWNMDAPNYPRGQQTNENSAILILGHPSADWGYAPLAAIYAPQQHEGGIHASSAPPGGAWNDMFRAVSAQALQGSPVERLYHDVPPQAPDIVAKTKDMRQALHQQWPDLDQIGGVYSVAEHMDGSAGAASFAVNAAFAAAYANQSGKSAVVTSLADPTDAWAVLIGPPPGWHPSPPVTTWDRARGESRAYWPWFGARQS
ncbi:hypothetical protein [Pandoraea sp. NPDC090278]|uniref:hypothetical protein n=1 Tax=Pandoraea sp. NPDC090278 TaxID=3364391 RepID=UPI00383B5DC7